MVTRRNRQDRSGQYEDPKYTELLARLAKNVRRLREEQDITQEEAADRCEMDSRMLQLVEAGKTNPTFTTLARLSKGFSVDASELLSVGVTAPRKARGARRKR